MFAFPLQPRLAGNQNDRSCLRSARYASQFGVLVIFSVSHLPLSPSSSLLPLSSLPPSSFAPFNPSFPPSPHPSLSPPPPSLPPPLPTSLHPHLPSRCETYSVQQSGVSYLRPLLEFFRQFLLQACSFAYEPAARQLSDFHEWIKKKYNQLCPNAQ